jgi:ABC-type iron transport system FetAB permease component
MKPTAIATGRDVFQDVFKAIFFYLILEKPFDFLQLAILLFAIFVGTYLIRKRERAAKLLGKVLVITGIVILVLRIVVVIYLAMQM